MSERALEFVEQWVTDHVSSANDPSQARALAGACSAAAAAEDIPSVEIAEAFDDLAAFIAGEIAEAKERAEPAPTDEEVIAEVVEREAEDLEEDEAADGTGLPKK